MQEANIFANRFEDRKSLAGFEHHITTCNFQIKDSNSFFGFHLLHLKTYFKHLF